MNLVGSSFVVVLVAIARCEAARTLPSFVTPCKINDPLISDCYRANIEKLRPRLLDGIRELQVIGIDPLHVSEIIATRNDSALINYRVVLNEVVIKGGKDFVLDDVDVNVAHDPASFKLKLRLPKVLLSSPFLAQGKMLGFDMRGPGNLSCDIDNAVINYSTRGKKGTRKGSTYIDWEDGIFDVTFENLVIKVGGAIENPEQLRLFNVALNENAKDLQSHLNPIFRNAFGAYIGESLRRVHKLFSYDVLYPRN